MLTFIFVAFLALWSCCDTYHLTYHPASSWSSVTVIHAAGCDQDPSISSSFAKTTRWRSSSAIWELPAPCPSSLRLTMWLETRKSQCKKDWIVLSNLSFCSWIRKDCAVSRNKSTFRWTSLSWPRALWLGCQSIQPLFNQWTLTMWHASALCFLLDAWRILIRVLGWKCPAPVRLHASEWMSMRHSWKAAWNKLDDLKIDREGVFRRWKIKSPLFDLSERRDSRPDHDFSCLESLLSHWFCPASTTFLGPTEACLRPTSNSQRLFADLRISKK